MNHLTSWKQYVPGHRVLMLFAPDPGDPLYRWQWHELQTNLHGLSYRNVTVLHFYFRPSHPPSNYHWTGEETHEAFKKYKVHQKEFAFILVDKDGQEKFRREHPLELSAFFMIVDVMPSRKLEMKSSLQ